MEAQHVAGCVYGYFGDTFERPYQDELPWLEGAAADNADIVREYLDGTVGLLPGNDTMPPGDAAWWENHRTKLEDAARSAAQPNDTART